MQATPYTSDLTVEQYNKIAGYLPPKRETAPRKVPYHHIINAIFYRLKNGCIWKDLPKDFPNHKTVFHYFNRWKKDGVWEKLPEAVCSGDKVLSDLRIENRTAEKKTPCPPC